MPPILVFHYLHVKSFTGEMVGEMVPGTVSFGSLIGFVGGGMMHRLYFCGGVAKPIRRCEATGGSMSLRMASNTALI